MEKVLVELFVPSLGESYDVFLPVFLTIRDLCGLLGKALEELSDQRYISSGEEVLCDFSNQIIFGADNSLATCGVGNGAKLMYC